MCDSCGKSFKVRVLRFSTFLTTQLSLNTSSQVSSISFLPPIFVREIDVHVLPPGAAGRSWRPRASRLCFRRQTQQGDNVSFFLFVH